MAFGGTLADLKVKVDLDTKALEAGLAGTQAKLSALGTSMMGVGKKLTMGLTLPIAAAVGGMAKAAMDLEATEAKYNTVFAGMTDTADAFIAKFKELTPATTAQARSMASGIQDLLVPMGFLREDATDLTGKFMHATGALANFNSGTHTAEQVAQAMQSAITGQTRSLKLLGINVDAADIEMRAFEMGLADANGEIDDQAKAMALLELVYENSEDALAAYNEESLDAKTKMGLMKAELIDVAASFGTLLLPVINKIIGALRTAVAWFANLTEGQQKIIFVVLGILAAVGPLLWIVGKFLTIIPGLIMLFGKVKIVLMALTGPIGLIILAVVALVAGIIYLWKTNEGFRNAILAIWEAIKNGVMAAVGFVQALWAEFGEDIIATGKEIWQMLLAYWNWIFSGLKIIWNALVAIGTAIADWLQKVWENHGESILAFLSIVWDQIKNVIETVINVIRGIIKVVTSLIQGDWKGAWEGIRQIGEALWNFLKRTGENIFNAFRIALSAIWQAIKNAASTIWQALVNAVTQQAQNLRTSVTNIINAVLTWLRGVPAQMTQIGRNMISGMISGIKNMASGLVNAAKGVVQGAVNSAKKLLGIRSDSKIFIQLGLHTGGGFETGLEKMSDKVNKQMQEMINPPSVNMRAFGQDLSRQQFRPAFAGDGSFGRELVVRHQVDLQNVPDSVDGQSLERRLQDMLNNPAIKRQIDRISFENSRDKI